MLDGRVVADTGGDRGVLGHDRHGRTIGAADGLRVASVGLRSRPLRAALSALGIAIGTAAIVAVLGLSASSQAGLLAQIDRLGTNLLTVEAGESLTGGEAKLPLEAPARITHLDDVGSLAHTGLMKEERVYRSSLIPAANSGGLQVQATSLNLPSVLGTGIARGRWLNRGHRPRAGRGARRGRRAAAGHRAGLPRPADLAGRPVVQRRGHPEALAAGARHRQQRPRRLPGRPAVPRLRRPGRRRGEGRPAELDLRARRHRSRGGGAVAARRGPPTPRRRTR